MMEVFRRILAVAIKARVEPQVFPEAAKEAVGNLFPERAAIGYSSEPLLRA